MEPNTEARLHAIEMKLEEVAIVVKKIRKVQKNAAIAKIVYFAVLVLLALGSLWFIKPFLSQLGEAYGLGDNEQYNQLLNKLDK